MGCSVEFERAPSARSRYCSRDCYWQHIEKTYDRAPLPPGARFGRLVVEECVGQKRRYFVYRCRCDCGAEVTRVGFTLKRSQHPSCGCYQRDHKPNLVHGHYRSSTYRSWTSMKQRCLNPNTDNYEAYGGRGIQVCARWLGEEGFKNFLLDMGERPKGKTLDRKNVNGNYEPDNCRWATSSEQNRNKRKHVVVLEPGC